MAYKDREKEKEAARLRQQRRRGVTKGVTEDGETLELVTPSEENVTPFKEDVNPSVTPSDAGWPHVIEFLRRPARAGDIDNMLKLQRIAGALAHVSKDAKDTPVWFGSLDVREIGKVIGTAEPNLPPVGPPVRV